MVLLRQLLNTFEFNYTLYVPGYSIPDPLVSFQPFTEVLSIMSQHGDSAYGPFVIHHNDQKFSSIDQLNIEKVLSEWPMCVIDHFHESTVIDEITANWVIPHSFENRPWYNVRSPFTRRWLIEIQNLVNENLLDISDCDSDLSEGHLSPSSYDIIRQVFLGLRGSNVVLAGGIDNFFPPELTRSQEERKILFSLDYQREIEQQLAQHRMRKLAKKSKPVIVVNLRGVTVLKLRFAVLSLLELPIKKIRRINKLVRKYLFRIVGRLIKMLK